MTTSEVTFYAGAAEAAGTRTTTVELPDGSSAADLVTTLGGTDGKLAAVLDVCTLLLDGRPATPADVLPSGAVKVDVLPPFAGG